MKNVMFVRGLLTIMLLLALNGLTGCGEKEQAQSKSSTVSKQDVKKETKEAYGATKAYTQEQMQAFREKMEARLAEYQKEIDQLQAKVQKSWEGMRRSKLNNSSRHCVKKGTRYLKS